MVNFLTVGLAPHLPDEILENLSTLSELLVNALFSVLYADIVNFTLISSYHSATEVVILLNYLFCLIDKLTDKYEAFKVSQDLKYMY